MDLPYLFFVALIVFGNISLQRLLQL